MNYLQFRTEIYDLINRDMRKTTSKLTESYAKSYKEVANRLQALYANSLAGIAPDDYFTEAVKYQRYNALMNEIESIMGSTFSETNRLTLKEQQKVITESYYYNQYANQWGAIYPVTIINQRAVQLSIYYTEKAWEEFYSNAKTDRLKRMGKNIIPAHGLTLKSIYQNNNNQALKKIKDTVTAGLIQGRGYRDSAKLLKDEFNKSLSNAERVMRTEGHRNMLTGEYINYEDTKVQLGDRVKRMIISALDARTRKQSLQVNQQVANEEGFLYPDGNRYQIPGNTGKPQWDINDREAVIEIIDDESPEAMRAVNPVTGKTQVYSFNDYPKWLDQKGLKRTASGEIVKK